MNKKTAFLAPLGFASGLPLALSSSTLQAWLTVEGVDILSIGLISMAGLPYTLKFLWAPFLDRFSPSWLDRRRGWLIAFQLICAICMAAMPLIGAPKDHLTILAMLAFFLATASASQDIVTDAYRTEILRPQERGIGVAMSVFGYRIGMMSSGALALYLAGSMGWQNTYFTMAILMATGIAVTISAPSPPHVIAPASMSEAVIMPLKDLFSQKHMLWLLVIAATYKLGDAFASGLSTTFLIREAGFSLEEIGLVNKAFGLSATIGGAFLGGAIMKKMDGYKALLIFGLLQAISNLGFFLLACIEKNIFAFIFVAGFENLASGMGTAAFVAFLMSLCDTRYTATQYAIVSAISSVARVFVGPMAAILVEATGWPVFFIITTVTALPALILIRIFKHRLSLCAS